MTLNPQIALFAALLSALGGPVRAGSHEGTEANGFRKAPTGLQQVISERPHLEPPDPELATQE